MRFIVAMILLICTSPSALALKPASKKELKELTDVFLTIKNIGELIAENRLQRDNATPKERVELDQKYMGLKEIREAPCRRALWLTIKAYDLLPFEGDSPILPSGVSSLRSPEIGTHITWVPVFEEKTPYDLQNAVGKKSFTNVTLINTVGNTASDGVSRIFAEAFTTPAALASVIYHERIHFKQFTSAPPDRLTAAEREVAAYSEQRKVWRKNLLGMTQDELDNEDELLTDNLEIYNAKAAAQRAEVEKAKGLPRDEYSIVSHHDDEINKLIAQARDQIKIANDDHDARLRYAFLDLAERSCANSGSITQADLDGLPQAIGRDFSRTSPQGLKGCVLDVYYSLSTARDANAANAVQSLYSRPMMPAPVQTLQPVRQNPFRPAASNIYFVSVLSGLKNYAVRACNSTGEAPIDTTLTDPREHFLFMKDLDDRTANNLAAGLDDCEGRLFRELIRVIRSGEGRLISSRWVKDTVAGFRPPPDTSSGNIARPPRGETVDHSCPVDPNGVRACPAGWELAPATALR